MKQAKMQVRMFAMRQVMHKELQNTPIEKNKEFYLFTGAKGYYLGGGWWLVSGYSQDGKDVDDVINRLTVLRFNYEFDDYMKGTMDAEEYHHYMSDGDIGGIAAR